MTQLTTGPIQRESRPAAPNRVSPIGIHEDFVVGDVRSSFLFQENWVSSRRSETEPRVSTTGHGASDKIAYS